MVVPQEVQVTHGGAAGHSQLAREMAAIGQETGAGAFTNQLQDALQPVVLGAGGSFHVSRPVPLDGTRPLYAGGWIHASLSLQKSEKVAALAVGSEERRGGKRG